MTELASGGSCVTPEDRALTGASFSGASAPRSPQVRLRLRAGRSGDLDAQPWRLGHAEPVRLIGQRNFRQRLIVVERTDQVAGETLALDVGSADGDVRHRGGRHLAF